MPISPLNSCRKPGCPRLTDSDYCSRHHGERHRDYNERRRRRADAIDAFYKTAVWIKLRAAHLVRESICRQCKARGVIRLAHEVDHLVPIRAGGVALDDGNLQSLCGTCHRKKTAADLKKFGKGGVGRILIGTV